MVVWRQFATGSIIEILNRKNLAYSKHQLTPPPSPHLLDCRNGNESPWSGWIMERGTRRVERRRRHRLQSRKTEAKEEPTETTATVAPPDNIPFWKSDFSAVLAIFAASFLPPVRTFVLYLPQLCAVIQVILLIPRRLPQPASVSLPPPL